MVRYLQPSGQVMVDGVLEAVTHRDLTAHRFFCFFSPPNALFFSMTIRVGMKNLFKDQQW